MPAYQPPNGHRVWFDGSTLNDADWASTGLGVHLSAIEGWEGAVEIEDAREPRPRNDGELANTSRMRGRELLLMGTVNGSTWEDLQTRKRALAAKLNPSSSEALLKMPTPAVDGDAAYADYAVSVLGSVAHWRLSGTSATAAGDNYEGTAAYDLTFSGSPTYGATGGLEETGDTAVTFPGSSARGVASYDAALNPAAFSVSMWVRPTNIGSVLNIYHSAQGTTNGFRVQMLASGAIRFTTMSSGASNNDTSAQLTQNEWAHVVCVYDGTNASVYIDGAVSKTAAPSSYTQGTAADTGIGDIATGGSAAFEGDIQAVTLTADELTATEIANLYTLGSTGYLTTSMHGYERTSARVVESLVFEDLEGPLRQGFSVALRASDPRIYSDVETSDSDTGTSPSVTTSNGGTIATPATYTASGPINGPWRITNTTTGEAFLTTSAYDLADAFQAAADMDARTFKGAIEYATIIAGQDPLIYLKLDESSGTSCADASGNSYTFTASTAPTWSQTASLAEGTGTAATVAASQNIARTITSDTALDAGSTFSWSMWIKCASTSSTLTLTTQDTAGPTYGYDLLYNASSAYIDATAINDVEYVPVPLSHDFTEWHHVAWTYTSPTWRYYVDGALVGSKTENYVAAGACDTMTLAVGGAGITFDEVCYWARQLSASEILAQYQQGNLGGANLTGSRFSYVDPAGTTWGNLAVGSNTVTLTSDASTAGTDSGTSLTVAYREARL